MNSCTGTVTRRRTFMVAWGLASYSSASMHRSSCSKTGKMGGGLNECRTSIWVVVGVEVGVGVVVGVVVVVDYRSRRCRPVPMEFVSMNAAHLFGSGSWSGSRSRLRSGSGSGSWSRLRSWAESTIDLAVVDRFQIYLFNEE